MGESLEFAVYPYSLLESGRPLEEAVGPCNNIKLDFGGRWTGRPIMPLISSSGSEIFECGRISDDSHSVRLRVQEDSTNWDGITSVPRK